MVGLCSATLVMQQAQPHAAGACIGSHKYRHGRRQWLLQQITWESTTAAFPAEMDSASSSSSTSCFFIGTWQSMGVHRSVVLLTNAAA